MPIECHLPPSARRVSLIRVGVMRGDGGPENPERMINLYYNDEGELVACYDPLNGPPDSFYSRPDLVVSGGRRAEHYEG